MYFYTIFVLMICFRIVGMIKDYEYTTSMLLISKYPTTEVTHHTTKHNKDVDGLVVSEPRPVRTPL